METHTAVLMLMAGSQRRLLKMLERHVAVKNADGLFY